jgi:hypothetical protein
MKQNTEAITSYEMLDAVRVALGKLYLYLWEIMSSKFYTIKPKDQI